MSHPLVLVAPRSPMARAPVATRGRVRRPRVVVGVAMERRSACALSRAHAMSEALGLDLVVVHVAQRGGELTSDVPTRDRTRRLEREIRAWAADVGVPLGSASVVVRYGRPATKLVALARTWEADLLVLGGALRPGRGGPGSVVRAVVGSRTCPLLIAKPRRPRGGIMAATDLRLATTPVVWAAADLAARANGRVTLVHNARTADRRRQRAFRPSVGPERLCATLETLDVLVRSADVLTDATVTQHDSAARGILKIARARDVDILAIGARARLGRTLESVIAEASRTLLVVPIATRRR